LLCHLVMEQDLLDKVLEEVKVTGKAEAEVEWVEIVLAQGLEEIVFAQAVG